jgi:hypothetical protein
MKDLSKKVNGDNNLNTEGIVGFFKIKVILQKERESGKIMKLQENIPFPGLFQFSLRKSLANCLAWLMVFLRRPPK